MDEYKIVRGSVNADGSIEAGSGFDVTHTATGLYYIDFNPAFNSFPTIVVTQNYPSWDNSTDTGSSLDNGVIYGLTKNRALLKTGDQYGDASDRNFCFIAIGA